MTDPILKTARNSLWAAIENWPALDGVFKRFYKFDGDDSPEVNPDSEQLPAIMIFPAPGLTKMVQNRVSEIDYKLMVLVFTSTWNLTNPDLYWQEIVKAAWQSGGGSPYVKVATGFYPRNQFTVDFDRITLDSTEDAPETKATLTSIGLTLQVRFDPQG